MFKVFKLLETKKRNAVNSTFLPFSINAADRNRTGTGITTHGILSPGRLPVPPLRHSNINITEWDLQGSNL